MEESKINKLIKDKYLLILLGILIFAFILRIWVFSITINQPVWWDEADYLSEAKRIGLRLEHVRNLWYYRRTFFLPLFWGFIYRLGGIETTLRFTEFLFSFLAVIFTYLVGKEIFNKEVGLVAAFGMSICRIHLFLTGRLLTSLPATTLFLVGLWLFWKGYFKKQKCWFIWLSGLFIGLAIFVRFALFLSLVPFIILVLLKEKLKLWKNKHIFIFFLIIFLILTPFFIKYVEHYPEGVKDFIRHYTGIGKKEEPLEIPNYMKLRGVWAYFKNIIVNTSWPLFIFFLIGCGLFIDLVLGYDLIFKNKELIKLIFILFWILPPLIYHGWFSEYVQERYLMWTYPAIFMLVGVGLLKMYRYGCKYNKRLSSISLVLILVIAAYSQISAANNIITIKKNSYLEVKESSLWIKNNTNPGDVVLSQSSPQTTYYSERKVYGYDKNKEEFEKKLSELNPKYAIVSIFEHHPDWLYSYFEKNKDRFTPIKVYRWRDKPVLIIYKFRY